MSNARKFTRKFTRNVEKSDPVFEGLFDAKRYAPTPERTRALVQLTNKLKAETKAGVEPEWLTEIRKLERPSRSVQLRQIIELIVVGSRKLN